MGTGERGLNENYLPKKRGSNLHRRVGKVGLKEVKRVNIRRKTEDFGLPAGVIEIELTSEELEQAFREKEHQYRLEDAKNAIHDMYESEQISEETYEKIEDNSEFHEAVLQEYDKRFSCNIPENTTWEEAIKSTLKEAKIDAK